MYDEKARKSAERVFSTSIQGQCEGRLEFEDCYIKSTTDTWGESVVDINGEVDQDTSWTHKEKTAYYFHFFKVGTGKVY
jgi:hypothetical protein